MRASEQVGRADPVLDSGTVDDTGDQHVAGTVQDMTLRHFFNFLPVSKPRMLPISVSLTD